MVLIALRVVKVGGDRVVSGDVMSTPQGRWGKLL